MIKRTLTIFVLGVCFLFMIQTAPVTQAENFIHKDIDFAVSMALILDPGGEQFIAIDQIEETNIYFTENNPAIGNDTSQVKSKLSLRNCFYQSALTVLATEATGDEVPFNLKHPLSTVSINNILA